MHLVVECLSEVFGKVTTLSLLHAYTDCLGGCVGKVFGGCVGKVLGVDESVHCPCCMHALTV